ESERVAARWARAGCPRPDARPRGVGVHARRDMERDEAAQARPEKTELAGQARMRGEPREHGFDVFDARRNRRLFFDAARLAAAAKVEAREREASPRKHVAEQEVLVAVLGCAQSVTRDDARDR